MGGMGVEKCVGKFVKKFGCDAQQSSEIAPGRYGDKGEFYFIF